MSIYLNADQRDALKGPYCATCRHSSAFHVQQSCQWGKCACDTGFVRSTANEAALEPPRKPPGESGGPDLDIGRSLDDVSALVLALEAEAKRADAAEAKIAAALAAIEAQRCCTSARSDIQVNNALAVVFRALTGNTEGANRESPREHFDRVTDDLTVSLQPCSDTEATT